MSVMTDGKPASHPLRPLRIQEGSAVVALPLDDGRRPRVPAGSRSDGSGPLRIDKVGQCLLVSDGRVSRRGSMVARTLPVEDGRIAVVVPDSVTVRVAELVERLWRWVPAAWESVRLVMADAASPGGSDRPVAQQLSEMLGVEVVAPSGSLLAVPDGSLFVMGNGRDAGNGAWARFRPGRAVEVVGRRFPVPEWEHDLAGFVDPGIAGVEVAEVPAGLWMRWAGRTSSTDLGFAVPMHSSSMALLVSRAGDPPLRNADVRRLLQALPVALWDCLTVVPYGDEPIAGARLGAVVSVATNRVVPVRTGLALCRPGGGVQVVAVGGDGEPAWSPFAHTMAWPPHGGSRLLGWVAPAGHLLPVGPGQLQLNERWLVEVVEAGLWLREIDRLEGAAVVRRLPVRSRYCTVVVGGFDAHPRRPPWRAIVKLVRQLPGAARARLRLAVPEVAGERLARAVAKLCRRRLGGRPVYVLTGDGELVRYPKETGQRSGRSGRETIPPEGVVPAELELSRSVGSAGGYLSIPGVPLAAGRSGSGWPDVLPRDYAADSRAVPAEGGLPVPDVAVSTAEERSWVSPAEPPALPPALPSAAPAPDGAAVSQRDEPADP